MRTMMTMMMMLVACTGAFARVAPGASCGTLAPDTRVKCCDAKFAKSIPDACCRTHTTSCMNSSSDRNECCRKKSNFNINDAWCKNTITFVNECGKDVSLTISGMSARTGRPFFDCGLSGQLDLEAGGEFDYVMLNDAPYFSSPDVQSATVAESGSYVYGMNYTQLWDVVTQEREDAKIPMPGARDGAMDQCEDLKDVIFFDASHARDMSSRTIVLCGMN